MLKFGVIKQNLYIIDNDYLASDSQNYVVATFEFDEDWTDFTKTAVFYQDADTVYHQVLSNNQCVVPYETLANTGKIYVGVFGIKDTQRITTNFANLSIIQGSYGDGLTPEAPTADVYAQIIAIMEQQAIDAQAAEAAQQASEDARDASIEAKDIAVSASESASSSADNAQLSEDACAEYYNQMSTSFVEKQDGYELLAIVDKERLANTSGTNTGDQDLSNYVTKVTGKGLSTNDLTNELKSSYDNASAKAHTQNTDMQLKSPDGTLIPIYTDNGGAVHIDGDIYQEGATYETHAEQVYTKDNTIILRDEANAGLSSGEYAGFIAKKYDGTNDGHLVFDKDGIALVGDIGNEQPLATREETPINGGVAKWNNTTLRFETSEEYVKDTDYATSSVGGVIKTNLLNNYDISNGQLYCLTSTYNSYLTRSNGVFISKGTLDNVLNERLPYYQTKTTLDSPLQVGTTYELGTLTDNISMALPTGTTRQRICVKFNCTGTAYTFTLTGTNFTTFSLTPVANTCYDVEFEYNGATSKWTGYVNSYLA